MAWKNRSKKEKVLLALLSDPDPQVRLDAAKLLDAIDRRNKPKQPPAAPAAPGPSVDPRHPDAGLPKEYWDSEFVEDDNRPNTPCDERAVPVAEPPAIAPGASVAHPEPELPPFCHEDHLLRQPTYDADLDTRVIFHDSQPRFAEEVGTYTPATGYVRDDTPAELAVRAKAELARRSGR